MEQGVSGAEFAPHHLHCLFIADRFEGLGRFRVSPGQDAGRFVNQPVGEHEFEARFQPLVELLAVGKQPDFQNPEALEGIARPRPDIGRGTALGEADLDRPNGLGQVVGVDAGRRRRIEAPQQPVDQAGTPRFASGQPRAELFISPRPGREAFDERPKIETGSAGYHRKTAAFGDLAENRTGGARIIAGVENLIRVQRVDQEMRDAAPLRFRGLGRSNVETAVHLDGIAVDDFAGETGRDAERQSAFARPGGADDGHERRSSL